MVQSLLVTTLFIFSLSARADFFGFGGDKASSGRISAYVDKVKALKISADPTFEDEFNKTVQSLENAIEEEKLFCSGESQDDKGRVLPKEQKQLCFRDLKKTYLDAVSVIFEAKKKYLAALHNRQLQRLTEIQKEQEAEIEKSF